MRHIFSHSQQRNITLVKTQPPNSGEANITESLGLPQPLDQTIPISDFLLLCLSLSFPLLLHRVNLTPTNREAQGRKGMHRKRFQEAVKSLKGGGKENKKI